MASSSELRLVEINFNSLAMFNHHRSIVRPPGRKPTEIDCVAVNSLQTTSCDLEGYVVSDQLQLCSGRRTHRAAHDPRWHMPCRWRAPCAGHCPLLALQQSTSCQGRGNGVQLRCGSSWRITSSSPATMAAISAARLARCRPPPPRRAAGGVPERFLAENICPGPLKKPEVHSQRCCR